MPVDDFVVLIFFFFVSNSKIRLIVVDFSFAERNADKITFGVHRNSDLLCMAAHAYIYDPTGGSTNQLNVGKQSTDKYRARTSEKYINMK